MAVVRVQKNKNYTSMSNYHFKEKEMSLKAKGLLSVMLSLPDNWDYSVEGLVGICKENELAIKNTLKELKEFGYLEIIKLKPNETDSGRIEYIYNIYEKPKQKQEGGFQPLENQAVEKQEVENQGQLNTKELNTNNKKKNISTNVDISKESDKIPYAEIIDYLNKCADKKYKSTTKKTRDYIKARWNEGFTFNDFKTVINNKVRSWKGTKWEDYLRPSTLFNSEKFEGYLNEGAKFQKQQPKISSEKDADDLYKELMGE